MSVTPSGQKKLLFSISNFLNYHIFILQKTFVKTLSVQNSSNVIKQDITITKLEFFSTAPDHHIHLHKSTSSWVMKEIRPEFESEAKADFQFNL
jgi:hypothetical protein